MRKLLLLLSLSINSIVFSQQKAITDTGTNVGIGTTTPDSESRLHVESQSGITDFTILATSVGINNWSGFYKDASNNFFIQARNGFGTLTSNIASSGDSWLNGGNIGIGTSSPSTKLFIKQSFDNSNGGVSIADASAGRLIQIYGEGSGGRQVIRTSGTVNPLAFDLNGNERMRITSNGYVGIGITSPNANLEVINEIRVRLATNNTDKNIARIMPIGYSGITGAMNWALRGAYQYSTGININAIGGDLDLIKSLDRNTILATKTDGTSLGNVGIGTTTPDARLSVNGNIHTKEVRVDLIGWSDFVFNKNYNLPTLKEVEQHIKEKGHLQDIPSAEDVEENGIFLGDMNAKLLQKIEELTLYTIEQQKLIENQNDKIDKLEKESTQLQTLSKRLADIEKLLENKKQQQ